VPVNWAGAMNLERVVMLLSAITFVTKIVAHESGQKVYVNSS